FKFKTLRRLPHGGFLLRRWSASVAGRTRAPVTSRCPDGDGPEPGREHRWCAEPQPGADPQPRPPLTRRGWPGGPLRLSGAGWGDHQTDCSLAVVVDAPWAGGGVRGSRGYGAAY